MDLGLIFLFFPVLHFFPVLLRYIQDIFQYSDHIDVFFDVLLCLFVNFFIFDR